MYGKKLTPHPPGIEIFIFLKFCLVRNSYLSSCARSHRFLSKCRSERANAVKNGDFGAISVTDPQRNCAAPISKIRGTQRHFLESICSEDDLRSRIFGTFVVKFLPCLPVS